MDEALLAARVLLAAVFGFAGAAKLSDPRGTRAATIEFGAPASAAPALSVALPVAELATAALLVPAATARVGASAALGFLLAFSVAIYLSLARGRRPDCHCLGQLQGGPVGSGALGRNFVLALVAGFVVVAEG
jgi:uncharacterized membrane protein YphA (DoxX/SURF4 family)